MCPPSLRTCVHHLSGYTPGEGSRLNHDWINSKFKIQNSGKDEILEIRPSPGWRAIDLAEIWRYPELFWIRK
jgi:hypothetical protein